jgi:ParB-like chromosome segregation protein Spo0J
MAKARAYARMRAEGISIEDITFIAGEPYETVKNHIALNELPEEVQQLIDTRKLGISFGLSLLKLKGQPKKCIELAENAVKNAWTRQKLENEISKILASFNETSNFPELPVTPGTAFSQENKPVPSVSQPSQPVTSYPTEDEPATAPSIPSPEPRQPTYPSASTEPQRDAAWDLALKHYPIGMVDFVWERVTIQGRRLQFLKVLLNVVWEQIVERNMTQEIFEEAKRRFEKAERITY